MWIILPLCELLSPPQLLFYLFVSRSTNSTNLRDMYGYKFMDINRSSSMIWRIEEEALKISKHGYSTWVPSSKALAVDSVRSTDFGQNARFGHRCKATIIHFAHSPLYGYPVTLSLSLNRNYFCHIYVYLGISGSSYFSILESGWWSLPNSVVPLNSSIIQRVPASCFGIESRPGALGLHR